MVRTPGSLVQVFYIKHNKKEVLKHDIKTTHAHIFITNSTFRLLNQFLNVYNSKCVQFLNVQMYKFMYMYINYKCTLYIYKCINVQILNVYNF